MAAQGGTLVLEWRRSCGELDPMSSSWLALGIVLLLLGIAALAMSAAVEPPDFTPEPPPPLPEPEESSSLGTQTQ